MTDTTTTTRHDQGRALHAPDRRRPRRGALGRADPRRRPARAVPRHGRRATRHVRPSSPLAPAAPSATCANGCTTRPRPVGSPTTRRRPRSRCPPSTRCSSPTSRSPTFLLGGFDFVASAWADEETVTEGVPHRRGHRLAPARPPAVHRHRAVLPARLPGEPRRLVAARARRRGRAARARSARGRRRVRIRRRDDPARRVVPELARSWASTTTTESIDDGAQPSGRRRASTDRVTFEVAGAKDFGGTLRPGVPVRLPARHGRPGRRGPSRPRAARPRRHVAARRAGRGRPGRGEPPPARPPLLRGVDDDLHAGVARAGGRARSRQPGRASPGCARSSSRPASPTCASQRPLP